MKNYRYIILQAILITGLLFSCSYDELDRIDNDPNNPTNVPVDLLLPQVEINMVNDVFGGGTARFFSTYTEHTANVHLNPMKPEGATGLWSEAYDIMMDLKIIIEKGSREGKWMHVGIAKVVYAFVLGTLTDVFGDVPYSEALQGSQNRNPHYDLQEDIYDALFLILDEAIADFKKNEVIGPGNYDLLLKGNKDMWEKVAWGLKARYFNRLSNIYPSVSATDALGALQNSFASPAEGLIFSDYTDGSTNTNPFKNYEQFQKTYAASVTILEVIDQFSDTGYNNDPRAVKWFNKIGGEIIGAPNGENATDQAHSIYSGISMENVLYGEAPLAILTYDEIKFIEAEANFRLGKLPEANSAYKEAVKAACARAGLSTNEINAYTQQGGVFAVDENLTLDMIIKQKFLSFFMMQPIEAFNDYRRTGIPELYNKIDGIIKRLPYPDGELATNSNAPTNINNVTIYTNKVWWAKE